MRKLSLTVLMSLGLLGCAVERVEPMTVPLVYAPSPNSAGITGVLSCTAIGRDRSNRCAGPTSPSACVRLQNKPLNARVSTSSDPTAWVRQGVDSYLSHNGLKIQASGPKLALTLNSWRPPRASTTAPAIPPWWD